MVDVLRAEWQKMVGNRWIIGLLVWVFPAGAFGFVATGVLIALVSPEFRGNLAPQLWTDSFLAPWNFASNLFGRTFLLGFTAVTFAGEYQWGTWKNIVPRQQRSWLIMAKFINLGMLILIAFGLMSLFFGFGYGVLSQIAGLSYGPEVTADILREFFGDYAFQATLAFISILIAAIYAGLSALWTQSILGGVIVGIGISIIEPLLFPLFFSLARMFNKASILHLIRFTPYYNIENVKSWVSNDQAINWLEPAFQLFNQTVPVDGLRFSVLVLVAWVVFGIGTVLYLFQRQDITT